MTLSTSSDGLGSTVCDDAISITVTHPDGTQWHREIAFYTKDRPPIDLTSAFQFGQNVVTVGLVDLLGPVRGSPRPFYLVNTATRAQLPVEYIPFGTQFNAPLLFGLFSQDPVKTSDGVYTQVTTDLQTKGLGPAIQVERAYVGNDPTPGPMGLNWTLNYFTHLATTGDNTGNIIVLGPQGRRDLYLLKPDGTYTAPTGVLATLTKNEDETYTLRQKDKTTLTFNSGGKLAQIEDVWGNVSTLLYNAQKQLVQVTDPAGRGALTLTYYQDTGLLESISDWLSPARTVRYSYTNGRLTQVTLPEGGHYNYTYDPATQRLATVIDPNGKVLVSNTFGPDGRVTVQKDGQGLLTGEQTSFSYQVNPDGTRTTTITYPHTSFNPNWRHVEVDTYDAQFHITRRVYKPTADPADWVTEQYEYTSDSLLSAHIDGRGSRTDFCWDQGLNGAHVPGSQGNLTRIIMPALTPGGPRPVTLQVFDTYGNVVRTVPARGVASTPGVTCSTDLSQAVNDRYAVDMSYDPQTHTNLTSVTRRYTDPELGLQTAITRLEYSDVSSPGLITRIIPPTGNSGTSSDYTYATTMTYYTSGPEAGMLASKRTPDGALATLHWDAVGQPASAVAPEGNVPGANPADHTWQWIWDKEGHLRYTIAPPPTPGESPLTWETRYDLAGSPVVTIDANHQVVRMFYDEREFLKEVWESPQPWTDPAVEPAVKIVTTNQYGPLGDLVRTTRAKGDARYESVTDYASDGLLRLRNERQYPQWPSTAQQLVSQRTYYPTSDLQLRTYTDQLGLTTTYTRNPLGWPDSITYSDGTTPNVQLLYDLEGYRTQMKDGTGTTFYTVDEMGILTSVTTPDSSGSSTVSSRHNLNGARTRLTYPDGTHVSYFLDKADRIERMTDWSGRTTTQTYLPSGGLKSITLPNGATSIFSVDNALHLRDVWNKMGENTISRHTCTRDGIGNCIRLEEVLPQNGIVKPVTPSRQATTLYTYNSLGWLTGEQGPAGTYTWGYSLTGNRTSETKNGKTVTSVFDRADRIQRVGDVPYVSNARGEVVQIGRDTLIYDQAGRPTETRLKGITHNAYNGDGLRVATDSGQGNFATHVYDVGSDLPRLLTDSRRKYVYGNDLAYAVDGNGTAEYFSKDLLFSIRATTYNNGNVTQNYLRNAWGMSVSGQGTSNMPMQFTSEWLDKEDGLIYLRARFYDPLTGRFIQRDPVPGMTYDPITLNRGAYGGNNPVNYVDPSGKFVQILAGAVAIVGIGAFILLDVPKEVGDEAETSQQHARRVGVDLGVIILTEGAARLLKPLAAASELGKPATRLGRPPEFPNPKWFTGVRRRVDLAEAQLNLFLDRVGDWASDRINGWLGQGGNRRENQVPGVYRSPVSK
jgi:RHS repeat-associated protein